MLRCTASMYKETMSQIRVEIRRPPEPPTRKQALKLFVLAAAGLFASSFAGALLPQMNPDARMLLLNALYYLIFLGLPCFMFLRKGPGKPESARPNPISFFAAFFIVVLAVLSVFFVNDILVLWSIPFQKLGFNVNASGLAVPTTRAGLTLCIVYAAVLPGIFEEFLFRGMVLPAFEKEGTRRAIRFSSLLFALLHGSVVGLPGQLLLGMLIAELVICCDSIYAGLIFHTAYNAAAVLIQFYQTAGDPAAAVPVEDYFAAIGGWGGVVTLLISILFTGAMLRICLRTFVLRARLSGIVIRPQQPRIPLAKGEKALLAVGIVMVALLYAMDIFAMLTM